MARRRRKKKPFKSYKQSFKTLPAKQQRKVNEAMISAVNKVSTPDGRMVPGTKLFLEARGWQLINDSKYLGWGPAANRFRAAVAQWARTHKSELEGIGND